MKGNTTEPVVDLVRRARDARASVAEQHAAFAVLVERFEAMAFATALRASDDIEVARDACQEALLLAWRTLPDLREPAAFGGWLKRLVRTQCARARRRRRVSAEVAEGLRLSGNRADSANDPAEFASRRETLRWILRAMEDLPKEEREAVTLFYFLGEPLKVVAQVVGSSVGTTGKRLYSARLRLRRCLPRGIAERFLVTAPSPAFARRVQAGFFDEFVGDYRFTTRPDHEVSIRREGNVLVSNAGGQRSVLASGKPDSFAALAFDGEGRFRRDRRGRVTHFVYYEFGRRLGVAMKVPPQAH
jgi:RNA polymerase sigma factor (sigma-70 family)